MSRIVQSSEDAATLAVVAPAEASASIAAGTLPEPSPSTPTLAAVENVAPIETLATPHIIEPTDVPEGLPPRVRQDGSPVKQKVTQRRPIKILTVMNGRDTTISDVTITAGDAAIHSGPLAPNEKTVVEAAPATGLHRRNRGDH